MTKPRCFVMARPSILVADSIQTCLEQHGVTGELGAGAFDRANWHQSLSSRYWPSGAGALDAKLQGALAVLTAYPAALTLNRIVRANGFCSIEADGTKEYRALLLAVKRALATQGLISAASNEPHISLSYWGSTEGDTIAIAPIEWVIDRVIAVEGWKQGRTYCYREVASIELKALPPPAEQQSLF